MIFGSGKKTLVSNIESEIYEMVLRLWMKCDAGYNYDLLSRLFDSLIRTWPRVTLSCLPFSLFTRFLWLNSNTSFFWPF